MFGFDRICLQGNPALAHAIAQGRPVITLFIWSENEVQGWRQGAASRWALHRALLSLQADLAARGLKLIIKKAVGAAAGVTADLAQETGAPLIVWNRRYEPLLRALDVSLKRQLRATGLEIKGFNSTQLLNEPHTRGIRKRSALSKCIRLTGRKCIIGPLIRQLQWIYST